MLQNVFRVTMILIALGVLACTSRKEETSEDDQEVSAETWKEMDDFHMIMAESFHPFKDSSNLEPAIKNADALAMAARQWADAALPEKVNNDKTEAKLSELNNSAEAFAELVKAGTPEEIGKSLTELHNQFHELQEEWYGAAADHEEHH